MPILINIFAKRILVTGILLFLAPTSFAQCKYYYDSISKRKIYTKADEMPEYPGGSDGWRRFLERNLQLPDSYQDEGMQGTVKYTYIIETNGRLSNISVNEKKPKQYNSLDSAFHNMLLLTRNWKPAKCGGKIVVAKRTTSMCINVQ